MQDILAQNVMKENKPSKFGRFMFYLLFLLWIASVVINIKRGHVNHPEAFGITIVGLLLFLVAKISVIRKSKISLGSSLMSAGMANCYRMGYWLMVIGILVTFT